MKLKTIFLLFLLFLFLLWLYAFLFVSLLIPKEICKNKYRHHLKSRFFLWRDKEMHYMDDSTGKKTDATLVLVHGFGASCQIFRKLVPHLQTFRVLRVDLPGFGLSDLPHKQDKETYVQLYQAFMQHFLTQVVRSPVCLVGNSMGGGIAWMTAALRPDLITRLILLNSAGYDVANLARKVYPYHRALLGRGMPQYLAWYLLKQCCDDSFDMEPQEYETLHQFINREGNLSAMMTLLDAKEVPDTTLLSQIRCPTLVIWGEKDHIIPLEHAHWFHHDIPNSHILLYPDCGHLPMLEKPRKLARDIKNFLSSS